MAFKPNINGFGGILIYKSTFDENEIFDSSFDWSDSEDIVYAKTWKGENPKNKLVQYEYEYAFVDKRKIVTDYIEQSISITGYDTSKNSYSTQKKLQNILSWAIEESRKTNGGFLYVCPRFDFSGLEEPTIESFTYNIFYPCYLTGYETTDIGNVGAGEKIMLKFECINQKKNLEIRASLTFYSGYFIDDDGTQDLMFTDDEGTFSGMFKDNIEE